VILINKSESTKLKGYLEAVSQRCVRIDVVSLKPSYNGLVWEKKRFLKRAALKLDAGSSCL
jgi:hypothetical protein